MSIVGRTLSRMFRRHNHTTRKPVRRWDRARLAVTNLEERTVPATITVTGNSDAIAADGVASLREAIQSINNAADANADITANITGTYGVADAIIFNGAMTISVSGHMVISKSVTITGLGESSTVLQNVKAANTDSRIFNTSITGAGSVTFASMTLSNGNLTTGNNGGAILNVDENITCNSVTFSGNKTVGAGGAFASTTTGAKLTLTSCTLSGNSAGSTGGAINLAASSTVSISGSKFSNNTSTGTGGVVHVAAASSITMSSSTISNNTATAAGAVINLAAATTVSLTNVSFTGNTTNSTGGVINSSTGVSSITVDSCSFTANTGSTGGAIHLVATSTTFDAKNSSFTNNRAATSTGGAIHTGVAATVTINSCTFTTNTASSSGGAIRFSSTSTPTYSIAKSSFTGNTSGAAGGAVYFGHATGAVTISTSTFASNTAATNGGAVNLSGAAPLTVNNSTFSGNTANGAATTNGGGAIFSSSTGSITINNSTLVENRAGGALGLGGGVRRTTASASTINLTSTIVAKNTDSSGANDMYFTTAVTAGGTANLVGVADVGNFTLSGTNQTGTQATPLDPVITGLGSFGGTTKTHALLFGSPAKDNGDQNGLTTDQTGAARPANPLADIGAREGVLLNPNATATVPGTITSSGGTTFQVTVVFTDETGVDTTTINAADVTVTGPGGYSKTANGAPSISGSGTSVTATYTFDAADNNVVGAWDPFDAGTYTVSLNSGQVFDTDTPTANSAFAATLGTFKVAINGTWTVSALGDVVDTNYTDGNVTLREAVNFANAAGGLDTIAFKSSLNGSPIILTSELSITDTVIVAGNGVANTIVDANSTGRLFSLNIAGVGVVTMNDLKLTGGSSAATGGAISVADDSLTMNRVEVSGNKTTGTIDGGAFHITTGSVSVIDSTIKNNTASDDGGAFFAASSGASITILRSTVSGNTAAGTGGRGGAVYFNLAGTLTITDSTIDNNVSSTTVTTSGGGGISIWTNTVTTITNSTFSGNKATNGIGGAIRVGSSSGQLSIYNSTISRNTAGGLGGGGISWSSATGTITFNVQSSIIAQNEATGGPADDIYSTVVGPITTTSDSDNFIGVAPDASFVFSGTQYNGDALLAPLGNYGGATRTHAILPGSPAISKGNNSLSLTYDQRGGDGAGPNTDYPRVVDTIDIGAYEGVLAIPAGTATANNVTTAGASTYTVTVVYTDDVGVDTASLGVGDITITGPGYGSPASPTAPPSFSGPATSVTATYTFNAPPAGTSNFDGADNGTYAINLIAGQIADTDTPTANTNLGGQIGSFKVNIPTNYKVDIGIDEDDGNYAPGDLSLREALKLANTISTGTVDTISFDASLNNTTLTLSLGEIAVSEAVVIKGNSGGNIQISGAVAASATNRIFNINVTGSSAAISIDDLEFTGGLLSSGNGAAILNADEALTLTNVKFTNNKTVGTGGAINSTTAGGVLSLTNCTFTGNSAGSTGGAINLTAATTISLTSSTFTNNTSSSNGGALNNAAGASLITLDSCTFTTNTATSAGGALAGSSGSPTFDIKASTFTGNTSGSTGGVMNTAVASTVTVNTSTFSNNTAVGVGGAIRISTTNTPSVTFENSTFSGNTSNSNGGGLYIGATSGTVNISSVTFSKNTAAGSGGGLNLASATVTINNSTFSGNTAQGATSTTGGGAINVTSTSMLTINNSTVVNNKATGAAGIGGGIRRSTATGSTTIISSIVAANTASTGADIAIQTGSVTIGGGANLIGVADVGGFTLDTTSGANKTGAQASPLDPMVAALANNGGPTQTHALIPGSPAYDSGNQNGLVNDQRGVARPAIDADIGAFEAPPQPTPTVNGVAADVTVSGGTTFDVTITFKDDLGVDISTIDVNDVVVKTAFGGTTLNAKSFVTSPGSGVATPVTATFTFDAPDNVTTDTWDASDTDLYSVWLVGTVSDADTPTINSVASPAKLTTFKATLGGRSMVVDKTGDIDDGDYTAGNLTIREAVNFSNLNVGNVDTITFGGALSSTTTLALSLGELKVTDSVIINATAISGITVSGANLSRVFNIDDSTAGQITVTMTDMTITGGKVTGDGAGIFVQNENLTLTRVSVSGNTATADGGGINFETDGGSLSLDLCTIALNTSTTGDADGGGINMEGASTFTMNRTTVAYNSALDDGGGLLFQKTVAGHSVLIENSTISNNTSNATTGGGGGVNFGGVFNSLVMRNSTVSGNRTTKDGGGLQFYLSTNPVLIQNCTIANNTATGANKGGGINRFTDNTGTLTLESTIVADNSAATGADLQASSGAIDSNKSAIESQSVTGTGVFTDLGGSVLGIDMQLTPLASNGGPTQTIRPLSTSPAKDAGFNTTPTLTYDQRGGDDTGPLSDYPRQIGAAVDIGAYEIDPNIPVAAPSLPNVTTTGSNTYTFTVTYTDDVAMDYLTITTGTDLTITGPSFGPVNATFVAIDAMADGPVRTATYSFTPPVNGATGWDYTDNGVYFVTLAKNGVQDKVGNSVPDGVIGFFTVNAPFTVEVDILTDESDGNYTPGDVSLREAILQANASGSTSNLITFKSSLFTGGPQTSNITLGAMSITAPMTIQGPAGANGLTLDGTTNANRAFSIDLVTGGGAVAISNMTLQKFSVTGNGGAIDDQDAVLTLTNMVLTNNTASTGGGAINLALTGSGLSVSNSVISSNTASTANGGGINTLVSVTMSLSKVSLRNNTAISTGGDGGGIYINGGTLTIDDSTVSGNTAANTSSAFGGGGMYLNGTITTTITNSTVSGNKSSAGGGGIHLDDGAGNVLFLRNSTVYGNSAAFGGGGINQRLTGSVATIYSSIIADNTGATGPDILGVTGTTTNVEQVDIKNSAGITNLVQTGINLIDVDPLLVSTLADNGGYVLPDGSTIQTHRLPSTSPAKDAGGNTIGLTYDERGTPYNRVVNSGTNQADIGAYEIQAPATVTSVVISDGTGVAVTHRSMVRQIIVTFSTPVNFTGSVASAFTVARTGNSLLNGNPLGNVALLATPATGPATTVTITFDNADTTFVESGGTVAQPLGSLKDGLYNFTIDASKISTPDGALDGDGIGGFGGNYAVVGTTGNGFYRFFGDSNGDGLVNQTDYNAFRLAFLGGPNNIFDFDGGAVGQVSQPDYNAFRLRFLGTP